MTSYALQLGPVEINLILNREQIALGIDVLRRARRDVHPPLDQPTVSMELDDDARDALLSRTHSASAAGRALALDGTDDAWARLLAARHGAATWIEILWSPADARRPLVFAPAADPPSAVKTARIDHRRIAVGALTPDALGRFDIVVCEGAVGRARCPIRLFQRLHQLLAQGGTALVIEPIHEALDRYATRTVASYRGTQAGRHWAVGLRTLERLARDAGFDDIDINEVRAAPDAARRMGADRIVAMRLIRGA